MRKMQASEGNHDEKNTGVKGSMKGHEYFGGRQWSCFRQADMQEEGTQGKWKIRVAAHLVVPQQRRRRRMDLGWAGVSAASSERWFSACSFIILPSCRQRLQRDPPGWRCLRTTEGSKIRRAPQRRKEREKIQKKESEVHKQASEGEVDDAERTAAHDSRQERDGTIRPRCVGMDPR